MTKITLKKVLMLGVFAVLVVSVAGCTSQLHAPNNQLTTTTNNTTKATTHTTAKPTVQPTVQPTVTPSPTPTPSPTLRPSPTPTPTKRIQVQLTFALPPVGFQLGETAGSEIAFAVPNNPSATNGLPIQLFLNGAYVGQTTTNNGFGSATFGLVTQAGSVTLTITFAGNAQFMPASASDTIPVNPTSTPTPLPTPAPIVTPTLTPTA